MSLAMHMKYMSGIGSEMEFLLSSGVWASVLKTMFDFKL